MIDVTDLVKSCGPVQALSGVSLPVAPGETIDLLGPNSTVKATMQAYWRMITGLRHIPVPDQPRAFRKLASREQFLQAPATATPMLQATP
jgi:ABC-type lipopolysaccharide export system ATPase subunit